MIQHRNPYIRVFVIVWILTLNHVDANRIIVGSEECVGRCSLNVVDFEVADNGSVYTLVVVADVDP